jgi:hypothetical protein
VTRRVGNNLGTIAPKHQGKTGSRANQKAGRINKIDVSALSAKPPSPVQIRAGGASKIPKHFDGLAWCISPQGCLLSRNCHGGASRWTRGPP